MKTTKGTAKKSNRFTKASFRKWKRENPEEFRKIYGPWTSLEATMRILQGVQPTIEFKEDGSDILGDIPFDPIDAMEFVCGFAAECGYTFAQPICDTISAYMKKGSTKTVKDLAEVIERAFINLETDQRDLFCEDGENCRHFELHNAYVEDTRLCEDAGAKFVGCQQCFLCKWWDNSHNGEPCDCTTGKCTYRWQDPNGKDQLTFWEEK